MSTIAFIGLGIMGGPMASHLVKAGHTVIGRDHSPERIAALVEDGGTSTPPTSKLCCSATTEFSPMPSRAPW